MNSAILKSKAVRAVAAACVFCFALGTGLSYLVVRTAQNERLAELSETSERTSQLFRKRLLDLDAEVREVVDRVELVSTQIVDAAHVAGTPPPDGEVPGEPSNGKRVVGVSPLEARWRERLEDSLRDMMKSRDDVLDITYLGRFTGIPNGALTVVRIERTSEDALVTSQDDPRPDWDAAFLQSVIQSDIETAMISPPIIKGDDDEARYAIVRGADPVRDGEGAVVGVAMVTVELSSVLERMTKELGEAAIPLLVTDEGLALLHPDEERRYERSDNGTRVISGLYPGLIADLEKNKGAASHSFAAETFVAHIARFVVGGEASDVRFSMVLSAPQEQVDFPTAARSAGSLVLGLFSGPSGMATAGVISVALLAGGAVIVWRRRSAAAAGDEAEQDGASILAERASAIEAEEAEAAEGDEAAYAADASDEASEEEDSLAADVSEDDDGEVDAAEDDDPEEAPLEAAERHEDTADEAEVEEELASLAVESDDEASGDTPEPGLEINVSEESLESAHELAANRNRLAEELEEARQRSLDELAAARERFEVELAEERDRAIARLIEESRRALAAESEDLHFDQTPAQALPAIETGTFELRGLLADVAAWMDGEIVGRDQEFGVRCNRNVPNQLVGDPDWLGPLLVNLGRNAVHANDTGRVELNVSCSDEGAAGVRVCFELRAPDTGFGALAGGHPVERRPGGLALVEELIESMHGELRAEQVSSTDAALRIVLPMSLPG